MSKYIIVAVLVLFQFGCSQNNEQIDYVDDTFEIDQVPQQIVEARSFLGAGLVRPDFDELTHQRLMSNLETAIKNFNADPHNPESIIWVARHTAYLWRYQDAIYILTDALQEYPDDPRLYRHRGHRYITVREIDKAIDDLTKARELIIGQPDEVEQDGAPNEANVPVSTLHFNIHYHLGVAQYINGDFDDAVDSFRNALNVSRNSDTDVSAADWLYMSLNRANRGDQATQFIQGFNTQVKVLESQSYLKRIQLYKGELHVEDLLSGSNELDIITQGYGVAMHHLLNGDVDETIHLLNRVIDTNYWAAFGYIAAEADLARGIQ